MGCGGGNGDSPSAASSSALRKLGLTHSAQKELRAACAAASRQIDSGVVYCPPVVPRGRPFVHIAGAGIGPDTYTIDLQMVEGSSRYGHWLVQGGDPRFLLSELSRRAASRHPSQVGKVHLQLFRIRPFSQGGGEQGGHVAAYWTDEGRGYVTSFHGYDNEAATLAVARGLIEEMKRCPQADAEQGEDAACADAYPARPPVRPASAELDGACRRLAAATSPVYCPPLVPAGRLEVEAAAPDPASAGYRLSLRSLILAGGKLGPWYVEAGEAGAIDRLVSRVTQSAHPIQVGGLPGKAVLTISSGKGGGALAKSALVVWSFDGRAYLLALKGFENEDLALRLAEAMAERMHR